MKALILTERPTSMDAVPDMMKVTSSLSVPSVGDKEVQVQVKASALNIEDLMMTQRRYLSVTGTVDNPVVLGQEFSGVVTQVGSKVTKWKVGDQVLGHKNPYRTRLGCWAEFVTVDENILITKGDGYSFSEAAALPMSALVAYGAVKDAEMFNLPLVDQLSDSVKVKEVTKDPEYPSLLTAGPVAREQLAKVKVAVVGASSTIGLLVVNLLAHRGVDTLGVCSASSAPNVLGQGALGVVDRHQDQGLGGKVGELVPGLDLVIDCVGGQEVEDTARMVLGKGTSGGRGHLLTVVGPGDGTFGGGTMGTTVGHWLGILSRTFKSWLFRGGVRYTLSAMPLSGGPNLLKTLMEENLRPVVDSEVDMFDEEEMKKALKKVNDHKTRGRLVLVNK